MRRPRIIFVTRCNLINGDHFGDAVGGRFCGRANNFHRLGGTIEGEGEHPGAGDEMICAISCLFGLVVCVILVTIGL